MPNRDGTGPMGDGRLGRGMGNCAASRKSTDSQDGSVQNTQYNLMDFGVELITSLIYKFISNRDNNKRK